jgi:hypothetical protein
MCFPTTATRIDHHYKKNKSKWNKKQRNTQRKRRQTIKTASTEKVKEAGWNGMAQRITRTNSYKKLEKRRTKIKQIRPGLTKFLKKRS